MDISEVALASPAAVSSWMAVKLESKQLNLLFLRVSPKKILFLREETKIDSLLLLLF